MGSGSSGRNKERRLKPSDILGTSLMTWSGDAKGERTQVENDFFKTSETLYNEYGNDAVPKDFFVLADMKPGTGAIAYYDGKNVGLNSRYMDENKLNTSYDECVADGFHPSRGNRSAAEAVAAHELGHRLTDAAAAKMGQGVSLDQAATRIVNEARREQGTHRGVVQMARRISGYATTSNAETISEALSDVYCNGSRASAESRAVVKVLNSYVK